MATVVPRTIPEGQSSLRSQPRKHRFNSLPWNRGVQHQRSLPASCTLCHKLVTVLTSSDHTVLNPGRQTLHAHFCCGAILRYKAKD